MTASDLLRRRWPLLLAVSLVLNGFLGGMLAVDWLWPHRGGGLTGERATRFELRRFEDRLPPEAAARVKQALAPLAPTLDDRLARIRATRAEVMRLAAAPEPDRAALDIKLEELRAEGANMQEDVQRATFDALLSLPLADRSALTEAGTDRP